MPKNILLFPLYGWGIWGFQKLNQWHNQDKTKSVSLQNHALNHMECFAQVNPHVEAPVCSTGEGLWGCLRRVDHLECLCCVPHSSASPTLRASAELPRCPHHKEGPLVRRLLRFPTTLQGYQALPWVWRWLHNNCKQSKLRAFEEASAKVAALHVSAHITVCLWLQMQTYTPRCSLLPQVWGVLQWGLSQTFMDHLANITTTPQGRHYICDTNGTLSPEMKITQWLAGHALKPVFWTQSCALHGGRAALALAGPCHSPTQPIWEQNSSTFPLQGWASRCNGGTAGRRKESPGPVGKKGSKA